MAVVGIGSGFEGAVAGLAATVPMTTAMDLMHRTLPEEEQYPLPPHEITMEVAEGAGVRHRMDQPSRVTATLVSHFGYGVATGALYGEIEDRVNLPPVVKGVAYGLGVWAVSYLGLLPAVGILESATKHPARRNAVMIAVHVVWGSALAVFYEAMKNENAEAANGRRSLRNARRLAARASRAQARGQVNNAERLGAPASLPA
jgi:uncharacterized membrane protein YagU involved in acid resistance